MKTSQELKIDPGRAVLLLVDVQERLAAVMPGAERATCERNLLILVELARRLGIPVVVSEQYPKGLGQTVPALKVALEGLSPHAFEKIEFACTEAQAFAPIFETLGRKALRLQWIVSGMETHVCVYQTARGLLERGASVQVPRDAVVSRTRDNWAIGLSLIERAGGVVTATETLVFDALGRAGTDDFRALSRLIK